MATLTGRTVELLKNQIEDGTLKVGEKLPTLNAMAAKYGVSRTVVREAVAALRSDGLLDARHGVGVFVRAPVAPAAGSTEAVIEALSKVKAPFLDLLELRMAFEVHAAGLAATRKSWAQEAKIWDTVREFETKLDDEQALDALDLCFHRHIAEATNNGAFVAFFNRMSLELIPQPAFKRALNPGLITHHYIQYTVVEHRAVADAISAGDEARARETMRAHLNRSHRRYRGFAGGEVSPLSNIVSGDGDHDRHEVE